MADFELSGIAAEQEAVDIVQAVAKGSMSPEEGATRLTGHWVPVEEFGRHTTREPLLATRQDSLRVMDENVTRWMNQGLTGPARRLAELDWLLAGRVGNEELTVQCAATLAQTMSTDPAATGRRLELLEFAVPEILAWDRPAQVHAVMLCNLADARFNEAGDDPEALRATIAACTQALSIPADIGDRWRARIHYVAGTAYQDAAESDEDYWASIRHLREALRYYDTERAPDEYASTLNNLGNTYRKLGARTMDAALVRTALDCYDKALPYRRGQFLIDRTRNNRAAAEQLLQGLTATTAGAVEPEGEVGPKADDRIAELFAAGDEAFAFSRTEPPDADGYTARAISKYLTAAKLTGRDAPARQRAEVQHRLAAPFIESSDDDELWTGVCFAAAARRLGTDSWRPLSLARVNDHLGFMLMKIGIPDRIAQLEAAGRMLRTALPTLETEGHPDEFTQAQGAYHACRTLLAVCGDEDAGVEVQEIHAAKHLQRLAQEQRDGPVDRLHATYQAYIALVRRRAERELGALLAAGEFSLMEAGTGYALDEDKALTLIESAGRRRDVGDLVGALEMIAAAERYAGRARFWAPSVWCSLALFYAAVPLRDEAERCLRQARRLSEPAEADADQEAGRIPLAASDTYENEISHAAAGVDRMPARPQFDPDTTAALLLPADQCAPLQRTLEKGLRRMRRVW